MSLRRLLLLLCLPLFAAGAEAPPEPAREFRGAWVASVYNLNWPSRAGLSAAAQQQELRSILDRAVELRLNAILLQVRPSSDALYASEVEPWSAVLTGHMGQAPGYDPLTIAVQEAHARGLELHAWFNPFRALTSAGAATAPSHVSRMHPEWMRRYGAQLITDPGEPAARDYVHDVIMDVVRRYDIDGVHIDDYFYPYPIKDKAGVVIPFPDDASWSRHRGPGTREEWRRANIDQFVQALYAGIKEKKPWVKFGISPFGIWRPRVPESIEAKLDAYAQLCADSRKWLNEGWCDYFSPQLYWSIDPPAQSFPVLLEWWRGQNRLSRHLWPGVADDRIGPERPAGEIIRQLALTRAGAKAPGAVHWDVKSLTTNRGGIASALQQSTYASPALVPACPWLGTDRLSAPRLDRDAERMTWKATSDAPVRWWAVQVKRAGEWTLKVRSGKDATMEIAPGAEAVAVRAIDRYGNAGPVAVSAP